MDGGQRQDLRVPTVLGACAVVIVWRGMVQGPHARDVDGGSAGGMGLYAGPAHTQVRGRVCTALEKC